ncbi:FAD-dependent oxidoreductase [Paludisphaera mucosa]|uniref:FAD-dependent oxidoreductase n=1 Tax=Paludisphaera mucosa TaxID=3030827 RepID=A0ABT6F420_9BACT|nr:FAD-dependent oxidoreductase [Paludisphaera mucosa]MDG3002332.1 FAD-dependent oxidoreductase [Paludisphaera mucosa]
MNDHFGLRIWALVGILAFSPGRARAADATFDVVVVGSTPGGIMAGVAAARAGRTAAILERGTHVGGLPANGLGATDIGTRGATGGLFLEFVGRVKRHYVATYGADSPQARDCSDGYHFEPRVAEQVFEGLIAEHKGRLAVFRRRQFDAEPANVDREAGRLVAIRVRDRDSGAVETYRAKVFIDATYEGDLAAAAGCAYRVGREGRDENDEPMAGRLYKAWGGVPGPGSTGQADNAIQAFNYRLCLTRNPEDRVEVARPARYDRDEYLSLADDVREGRTTAPGGKAGKSMALAWDSIGRIVNPVAIPNGKVDANNQHWNFLSSDLPEENWPWPTSGWDWRDHFAGRLRDYTLGLLYFAQNDPALPEDFRARCREWGLARSEFADDGHFPRQVYVREGRRVVGEYSFAAKDAVPTRPDGRPPIHADSVTASHYALDSHAVRKREPGRAHLDGFFSSPSRPYTVPYGVIVPKKVDGLLTPVPVSGTHVGFSTLRMEPCWMALGEAAGEAAALAIEADLAPRRVAVAALQERLVKHGAVLMYFRDMKPGDAHFEAVQLMALRGCLEPDAWLARPDDPVTEAEARRWIEKSGAAGVSPDEARSLKRGELLDRLRRASK